MTTLRSSLPSRLRQLLSGEGAVGPSVKLDSEPPPKIKAFIDKVIKSPLQDIAIPLSGFRWEYDKGNFYHWRLLFLHFDTYFKTYLACRKDLLLTDDILENDMPFPKHEVLQILRVTQTILENCHNKSSFVGLEHFKLLLAATDPEIVIATLEALFSLVKINPSKLHSSGKLIACGSVNSFLLSLAQGWGSKEEGLGLYSCVVANEKTQEEGLCLFPSDLQNDYKKSQSRLGSTLYFELHGIHFQGSVENSVSARSSSSSLIHIPDMHLRTEDDLSLMKQCIEQYNVPQEHRFALLSRIRYAHAFRSPRICRLYSKICLLAFIVLVQSNDAHDEIVSFFANEPEHTNELIRIVRSEEIVPGTIRTLAMLALGAQLAAYASSHDRARILSGSTINFSGGNRMILLNVLQRAIMSLSNSNDPSCLAFVEALLQFYLLHVISSSNSLSVVRGSGMVPTFLPLLGDTDPTHMHLVCYAVKTLQKLLDYSNTAVTLFKDLGGVELLAHRLQIEVNRVIDLAGGNDSSMVIGESSKIVDCQLHSQKRLIRVLLKALGSATYAHVNATRAQNSQDSSVPITLSLIFRNMEKFGGDIYSSAVTVMSELVHKDPTCLSALLDLGLPDAFLSSVVAGILPSSKAITCIPNGLGAVCLNAKGLDAVKETSALRFLVDIFTTKKYVLAMNEGIVPLANAVEELLRHVSSLRSSGVEIIIEIVDKIASIKDDNCTGSAGEVDGTEMEMESGDTLNDSNCKAINVVDSAAEVISDEQFIQLCIFHVMVLIHRTMENSETCRLFVEKSGIEALLKLLLRPNIAQSSEGMSIALHSTMVFKGFTQHHSAPLARAFCSTLRDQLKKALTGFSSFSGSFLLNPKETPDSGLFSSLFLIEFLLFLAASKDNRWVTALLLEFGNDSKDVLENIGCIHREVLWQIALLDDAKLEVDDDSPALVGDSQQSDLDATEAEEQRYNSFRQVLDPVLRRRTSEWSVESQFLDLINLYRDLGRATGHQQRLGGDGPSNLRSGVSHHVHRTSSSDVAGDTNKKEDEKQRSYYSSCCDMIRSLSFHITHLFQELGKVMLVPSRRREDALNVSVPSKSVASTFASTVLAHMNSGVHESPAGSETSITTKCRYFGKVVGFIDGILLDKPDSCNPILLNCLYGHGVTQSVLTTFEATSQLLFTTVNRATASPMEMDDVHVKKDEKEDLWIYGPLASYTKFMDHLATSSSILSPSTKHLLAQPLINVEVPFPRDAETFVKVLQSMVLKAVLPVWTHPQFTDCSYDFISAIVSIIRHVYSGVEVKSVNSNAGARIIGPPPSESTISTIVEMGFSRSRAEEALGQVGVNSVELAMEWLFSHPEESQEDDELARALAMSLGNSATDTEKEVSNESKHLEQEIIQLPPVDELLSTCGKLLQMKENLAFPVRDLLLMICSHNNGQYRSNVISFLVDQVKHCGLISENTNSSMLSALLHVLALILHEDTVARDVAFNNGLVKLASDLLSQWESTSFSGEKPEVPKWVTASFLAIDRMLHVDQKLNHEIVEQLNNADVSVQSHSITIDEKIQNTQSAVGSSRHIDIHEQKRLIQIACSCIRNQLPSETMHAALQLTSMLTRNHSVALSFLDAGGLPLLLSLPTSSLFPGFDNVAATIIRHILEDPQTLQQAMESEIRHSVVAAANRHSNGRLTPRNFLVSLASVISRDPVIFMQAAQSVCQIEMVGERPYVILLKDRDKDKFKEKDKEKERSSEKDKIHNNDGRVGLGDMSATDLGSGQSKLPDSNCKNVKLHRKSPQSFINVIELLLDSLITYVPRFKDDAVTNVLQDIPVLADMDIDTVANKGKGKAVATTISEESEANSQEDSAALAKIVFILKLLTEIILMYGASVHILVRRDAEVSSCRGPPQRAPTGYSAGGIFNHILHKFLPCSRNSKKEKKIEDWRNKLSTRASQFLVASCVRSTEARKRVFVDINNIFNDFVDSSTGFRVPGCDIQAFIDLLNDVLVARSPAGAYISAEASASFIDVGLVKSLTQVLEVLDLDHTDSSKVVTGLIKALELVTKEHVHSTDSSAGKNGNSMKNADQNQSGRTENDVDISEPMETTTQPNHDSMATEQVESLSNVQVYVSSEAVTDDMEHDQNLDGGFAPVIEEDYMHESSQDGRGVENDIESVGIRFEIQPGVEENLADDDDDDEEMSEEDGDEEVDESEDEDEEEHNELEEVHHLPHPDTDQDDHEIDEDEFDEEVMEEDEDDEDDEDGVILRLEEGINGINVLDHIEVLGRDNSFSDDTLHVMPVEVFGSRRQGRTTSIYNLLGRTGDNAVPSHHPLLLEPSPFPQRVSSRQNDGARDIIFSDRNGENTSSQLETVFRSLRNGRSGHRLNLWVDDNLQGSSSSAPVVPQGLEELLVSHLRPPTPGKSSDQMATAEPQSKEEASQLEEAEAVVRPATPTDTDLNTNSVEVPTSSTAVEGSADVEIRHPENETMQGAEASNGISQSAGMQFEPTDAAVRDVEAVSQESSGSGATLGESLRSLDVEIGSADGHDDGGERQGSAERMPLSDVQAVRSRRASVSFGNPTSASGRDLSLHSVTEVSESTSGDADQSEPVAEQQMNAAADSGSIDPAFLDALPEGLRAEVLSAQQGQVAQPPNDEPQNGGDIDPEFLAALPPDIRAEVLAQQQAQRLHQSQELEGQPVEMDTVSIIATFPSELREEVLLTSSDAILANLTPALVAEANMLRERFAHRYHNRTLFGMYPRSRRGESSRRSEGIGSGLDRVGGSTSRRSVGGKPVEAGGAPLVDSEALKAMIRLLRVVQPLYKGQLQRLLLNLCAHNESRTALVKILMDMLMQDTRKTVNLSDSEPSYRLYGCQSHVIYSRPQSFDGVPPLVSRRILETLTYLARNHLFVAKVLLQFRLPQPHQEPENFDQARGKGVMVIEGDETGRKQEKDGHAAIALLLKLLNQPLYLRSIAHLEQLLHLLDVVIDCAGNKSDSSNVPGTSATEQQSAPQVSPSEAVLSTDAAVSSSSEVTSSKADDISKPSTSGSGANGECDSQTVLDSLPQLELQLLCSFLAREGLSDNAYSLVAEVLKKLVAITPVRGNLFITELAKSVQNLTKAAMDELCIFGESEEAFLRTSSSDGAAILRVLQALSSLVGSLNERVKDDRSLHEEHTAVLSQIRDINLALDPLWHELSICISKVESYSDSAPDTSNTVIISRSKPSNVMPSLPAGTQNILPYIESFFVMCEKLHPAHSGAGHEFSVTVLSDSEDATTSGGQQKPSGIVARVDEKHTAFVKFSEKHRKLLNAFIRQNPGLLEKSFSLMLKVPRFIDFDNKRAHFRSKIKHQHDHHHSPLRISVRRAYILEDSYNQLRLRSTQDLKGRLTVHFQGEEGIDAGGLTREWYQLLSRVIFDKGALLFTTVGNDSTFQPNPNSVYQTEHLSYFKFVGRVVGKALFDGQLLDVHFTRSFYKHILGVKVTYHDIEAIDPDYFKNLKWMLEHDISDVLDLTFSIDADEEKLILYEKTEVTDYELIPGGRNIRVTEENKHQYVDLVAEHRLTTAIRPQINAFLDGFNELINRELVSIFNDKELELLISGLPDIDLDDMRSNTEYSGYSAASPAIQWFWEVVHGFSKEDKARLLQFVTGTSKVPLEGFSALQGISGSQKFQIHKAYGSPHHLPSAHTCFNQLDLPEYPSKAHLHEKLLQAIHEANEGFGFG